MCLSIVLLIRRTAVAVFRAFEVWARRLRAGFDVLHTTYPPVMCVLVVMFLKHRQSVPTLVRKSRPC